MKVAIVGGGILGLTLAHRLSRMGHEVDIYEAGDSLGGLCSSYDYGEFSWDKFYHCIMPQDIELLSLIEELGLSSHVQWTETKTAFFHKGILYPMSNNIDFLLFPLLSWVEKFRLAANLFCLRWASDKKLSKISAKDWLRQRFGPGVLKKFWQPLLRAKFGPLADRVTAAFLLSIIRRSFISRRKDGREKLGYLTGGYKTFFQKIENVLISHGSRIHLNTAVKKITRYPEKTLLQTSSGEVTYRHVFFTGPYAEAKKILDERSGRSLELILSPPSVPQQYLGVLCAVMVLKNPSTPYYLVNIADENSFLTGYVEMSNLVDRRTNLHGRSLVYLPKYVESDDSLFQESSDNLKSLFIRDGFRRLFPDFPEDEILSFTIQKSCFVQAVPVVEDRPALGQIPEFSPGFQVLNSAHLAPSNLFNNEAVRFVNKFILKNHEKLSC